MEDVTYMMHKMAIFAWKIDTAPLYFVPKILSFLAVEIWTLVFDF